MFWSTRPLMEVGSATEKRRHYTRVSTRTEQACTGGFYSR